MRGQWPGARRQGQTFSDSLATGSDFYIFTIWTTYRVADLAGASLKVWFQPFKFECARYAEKRHQRHRCAADAAE